jgi:sulfofructose kinase
VACSRLGWRTRYIGHFGDDDLGRFGKESLEREGVDIAHSRTVDGVANQMAVILVDARTGERTVLWQRPPSLAIDPDELDGETVTAGRVLLVDCHDTAAATRAASYANGAGVPTVIDVEKVRPGIEDLLRRIDVIIAAEAFPSALTGIAGVGEALKTMSREFRAPIVTATLGHEGSLTVAGGREIRVPAFRVPVVDTTGAGDVFRGGFIAGWLAAGADATVEGLLRYATAVAGLKCRALGARQGIPTRAEVDQLLR